MFITGHVSASYLAARLTNLSWVFLVAAAAFPDVVDKGLRLAGVFSTGRHIAHNLLALAVTTLVVACWRGARPALAWLLGYALHLAGDIPFSWAMPWFYPFEWGTWHNTVPGVFLGLSLGQLILDSGVTLVALGVLAARRFRRRTTARDKA